VIFWKNFEREYMKFEVNEQNGKLIFSLNERRLDAQLASDLKGEFLIMCTSAIQELIIDLSAVEFCDSSGLSSLLFAERQMRENGGSVKLTGLTENVASLIKISQLDRVFSIHATVDEALSDENEGQS
jgi:anti-sigma B factor antagonist